MPITIDERLLAHIHHDAFLKGSFNLQGEQFSITIQYLKEFLENKLKRREKISPEILQLSNACNKLLEYEKEIEKTTDSGGCSKVANAASEQCKSLKAHEMVLLPGGWMGDNHGHAMVYQIIQHPDGDYLFRIHNSGAGLQYHAKRGELHATTYNPVLTYKIPKEKINSDDFKLVLQKLMEARVGLVVKNKAMNEKYLYEGIFPLLEGHCDAKIWMDPNEPFHRFTAGQISGTCAQRSLHQLMKSMFQERDDYRKFIYEFKASALDDYWKNFVKSQGLQDLKRHRLVEKAIRHQLRLLNLNKTKEPIATPPEPLFPFDFKEKEQQRLLNYLSQLGPTQAPLPLKKTQKNESKVSTNLSINFIEPLKVSLSKPSAYKREHFETINPITGGENLLANMDALLKRCEQWKAAGQNLLMFEHLESFIMNLPLANPVLQSLLPYYASLTTEDKALEFMQKLNKMQSYLFEGEPIGGRLLPRNYVAKISLLAITAHVNANHPLQEGAPYSATLTQLKTDLKSISPYLATNDPILDARYLDAALACNSIGYQEKKYEAYFTSIIDAIPELKTDLEKMYTAHYSKYFNEQQPVHDMLGNIFFELTERAKELRNVNRFHCEALFYFIRHKEELRANPKFKPLMLKFDLQEAFEEQFEGQKTDLRQPHLKIKVYETGGPALTRPHRKLEGKNIEHSLMASKYDIYNTNPADALLLHQQTMELTDNKIQLTPSLFLRYGRDVGYYHRHKLNQYQFKKTDLHAREFFHLRQSPTFQVLLTLDHFNRHLEQLDKHEVQVYVEGNLFQPNLLEPLLREHQDVFFKLFDTFFENGLEHYQKNTQLTPEALTFIRLGFLIHQFANKLDASRFGSRFQQYYERLNILIATQKDPNILNTLHLYRFQTLILKCDKKISSDELYEVLESHFRLQSKGRGNHKLDRDSNFQLELLTHQLKKQLASQKNQITTSMLLRIIKRLGVTFPGEEPKITGEYPLYTFSKGNYTLNLEQGLLFKENLAYAMTPTSIIESPVVKSLKLEDINQCFTSGDNNVFLIEKPPISLRFIRDKDKWRIQRKWAAPLTPHHEEWYELTPMNESQAWRWRVNLVDLKQYGFLRFLFSDVGKPSPAMEGDLPSVFYERDTVVWRSIKDKSFLVTDGAFQVKYQGNAEKGQIIALAEGKELRLCQKSWIQERLSHFESNHFINAFEQSLHEFDVHLTRYNLHLQLKRPNAKTPFEFSYELDGISYILQEDAPLLGEGVAQLTFQHENESFCLLAVQPFLATNKRSNISEYHHLSQDIHHSIPVAATEGSRDWQFSNTESVMKIKMENGKPIPATPHEALYLTYIYLCSNQPDKAWGMLDYCVTHLGGLEGTYEELKYLHWITEYMPYPIKKHNREAKTEDIHHEKITNPEQVACKLKALALLAEFSIRTNKKIAFPENKFPNDMSNHVYEQLCLRETESFYRRYPEEIKNLFTESQKLQRDSPAAFTLTDAETKKLLDICKAHNMAETGALRYERVQLHFKLLRQEHDALLAKSTARISAALPPNRYETERLSAIHKLITSELDIIRTTSILEYQEVSCRLKALPQSFLTPAENHYLFNFNVFTLEAPPPHLPEIVASLSLNTKTVDLLAKFPHLLNIAITSHHPLKERLCLFCKAVLIAHRKMSLDPETQSLPSYCSLLLTIAEHHEKHPNPNFFKFDARKNERLFDTLQDIYYKALILDKPSTIFVPTLVDNYQNILVKAADLWAQTPVKPQAVAPKVQPPSKKPRVQEWLNSACCELRKKWQALERALPEEVSHLLDTKGLDLKEYQAGCAKYASLKAMQTFANDIFQDEARLQEIAMLAQQKSNELKTNQSKLEEAILTLATHGPDDPILQQAWHIDVQSGRRKTLDMHALLTLYFHNDIHQYASATGLSKDKIDALHDLLITYVAEGTELQHCQRVLKALSTQTSEEDKPRQRYELAEALFSVNRVDPINDPALSVFQLYEDKLLRAQQQDALARLLTKEGEGFSQTIEKIIMGGGKSKVILPTLAQKKADGTNLVMIEVPRALLRTNYVDLKSTSLNLFHQDAYLFEFNRDSNCSAKRLEELFEEFTDVMLNKRYIVTTGEALQSLELKYIEILNAKPSSNANLKAWEAQVLWISRLVSLVRHRGDLIIDEVHQGLLLKNKLNYTIGEPKPIAPEIVSHALELYQFFHHVEMKEGYTLEDAIQKREEFTEPINMDDIMQTLVDKLLSHQESPLNALLVEWKITHRSSMKQALRDYLLGRSSTIPTFIQRATPAMKDKIAFYKEQISNLLPFTLKRHQGEHFGPSKGETSPVDRARAIPYAANNVPKEQSRFGNPLETLDYTIQSLLITGIDASLMSLTLKNWIAEAYHETRELRCKTLDDTPMALRYQALAKNRLPYKFSELEADDPIMIKQMVEVLGREPALIYEVLKNDVLPSIKTNHTILQSNAHSHADLVRSCQGMSGTPWNHSTFHPKLHYSEASGLGTDGYVLRAIEEKKPEIRGIDFTTPTAFIDALFSNEPTAYRAIIDIAASFKGISNRKVAETLAKYIFEHAHQFSKPEPLKYVLFFDEGVLSALKVQADVTHQKPIKIGSSDPKNISEKLGGSSPDARFTYYDQEHTVGTDIKQGPTSKALVLADAMTPSQHFLQGSMRMRALVEGSQSIDIIVPKAMSDEPLNELFTQMVQNEKTQLQQENFNAAIAALKNRIRHDFQNRMFLIPETEVLKKHEFLQHVHSYFFESEEPNFFKRFGGVNETRETGELLEEIKTKLLTDWQQLLTRQGMGPKQEEKKAIQQDMEHIVSEALKPGVCAIHQISSKGDLAQEVEVELEQQMEIQTELEVNLEQEVQAETYDPNRIEVNFVPWQIRPDGQIIKPDEITFDALDAICKKQDKASPAFHEDLLLSPNFRDTYQGEPSSIGFFMKPVHALLFIKDKEKLKCVLLTQKDCEALSANHNPDASWWITTTQHTVLKGAPPINLKKDKTYHSMIEQVRFFNGEINLLLNEKAPLTWLEENSTQKIDFFKRHLAPNREVLPADTSALYRRYSVIRDAMISISKTPWVDRTELNWASMYHGVSTTELQEFKSIAKAFQAATHYWQEAKDLDTYCKQFEVPGPWKGYLANYLSQLEALKQLIACFETLDFSSIQDSTKASLLALCPELEAFIPSAHPSKQAADACLFFLIKTLPMCHEHPLLLKRLATNDDFYSDQQIPREYFYETLLGLATQGLLPKERYISVMKMVQQESIAADILEGILSDLTMPLPLLTELITPYPLTEKHIEHLLKREDVKRSKDLFLLMLNKVTTGAQLMALREHPCYHEIKAKELLQFIQSTKQDDMIHACLEHPHADEPVIQACLNLSFISKDNLVLMAKKSTNPEILEKIFNHQKFQRASSERDQLFEIILKNAERKPEMLSSIARKINRPSSVDALLSRKDVWTSPLILNALIKNPNIPIQALERIVTEAPLTLSMLPILQRPDMKVAKASNINLIKLLFKHPSMQHPSTEKRLFSLVQDSDILLEVLSLGHHELIMSNIHRFLQQEEEAFLIKLLSHPKRDAFPIQKVLQEQVMPWFNQLKKTQFFEEDEALEMLIQALEKKSQSLNSIEEMKTLQGEIQAFYDIMRSQSIQKVGDLMLKLGRTGKLNECEGLKEFLRNMPIHARVHIDGAEEIQKLISPSTFFQSSKNLEPEHLIYHFQLIGLASLKEQAKVDWEKLEKLCDKNPLSNRRALLMAELHYVLNHLIEKHESLKLQDPPIDALIQSFKTMIHHFEQDNEGKTRSAITDVQSKIKEASFSPTVTQFRGFKRILQLVHDACLACLSWITNTTQPSFFTNNKTKSHQLLTHLNDRISEFKTSSFDVFSKKP